MHHHRGVLTVLVAMLISMTVAGRRAEAVVTIGEALVDINSAVTGTGPFEYTYSVHYHSYDGIFTETPKLNRFSLPFFDTEAVAINAGTIMAPLGWTAEFVAGPGPSEWAFGGGGGFDPAFVSPPYALVFSAALGSELELNDPELFGFGYTSDYGGFDGPSFVRFTGGFGTVDPLIPRTPGAPGFVVPLPAAGWLGMVVLAGLGAAKARRGRA